MKALNIVEGWYNVAFPNDAVEKVAAERASICWECPRNKFGEVLTFVDDKLKEVNGHYCGECMCPLSAKLRSPNEKCDLGKW